MIDPNVHLRIARSSGDLVAAERFYVDGLGFEVLQRGHGTSTGERNLLMVGLPSAAWHLELIHDTARAVDPARITCIERAGGKRVPAHNPWWDQIGVTIEDPDGYRLVLCERGWGGAA